jgi:hypothetical protein
MPVRETDNYRVRFKDDSVPEVKTETLKPYFEDIEA